MANWAWTEYEIHGQKQTIEKIANVLKQLGNGALQPTDHSSKMWEGDVLHHLGMKNLDKTSMRGFIESWDRATNELLYITATEAWGITDFAKCLYELYTECDDDFLIELISEEPGCGYYVKTNENDDIYKVEYYKDGIIGSSELFYNTDAVENFLNDELKMTLTEANEYGYKDAEDYVIVKEFEQIYI